jgi:allantoinase
VQFDSILRNVRIVHHDDPTTPTVDIGITDGVITRIGPALDPSAARTVIDGNGRLAFPGVVDAHQHWGIYNDLSLDADSESRACAQGGVTTSLTYMRTGQYYLNQGGIYEDFFPKVLASTQDRSYVDYAFHLAPMMSEHIEEIPDLIQRDGVTSFKIFMFYGSHGLHGRSSDQNSFLMIPPDRRYDIAHFEFVMRGIQQAREALPQIADDISLSLHCETAEIMGAYTAMVEESGQYTGLEAYHHSRPPHSEGLAITIASYLAHETNLPNINLLHLSSRKAMDAAVRMKTAFPHVNFRREVTVGHLLVDIHSASGIGGKVNPPLRPREDVEALWEYVLAGEVDWIVSDHACCRDEMKFGTPREDVFVAKSGFGGAEYLLAGVVSEGSKRGLSPARIAELTARNPAQRYGLHTKGVLAQGYDADIALVDDTATWTVRASESESTQEYTPFEGMELAARVTDTFVRGHHVYGSGSIQGAPVGRYLSRPTQREMDPASSST